MRFGILRARTPGVSTAESMLPRRPPSPRGALSMSSGAPCTGAAEGPSLFALISGAANRRSSSVGSCFCGCTGCATATGCTGNGGGVVGSGGFSSGSSLTTGSGSGFGSALLGGTGGTVKDFELV